MKDDTIYVAHMLEAISDIKEMTAGMGERDFLENKAVKLAALKCIEIIGEAAKNLSDGFRKKHPSVPWSDIIKMRDKTVHFYFGIKYGLVWEVVQKNLPELEEKLEAIMLECSGIGRKDGG